MKKIIILCIISMSMILAACAPEARTNNQPVTNPVSADALTLTPAVQSTSTDESNAIANPTATGRPTRTPTSGTKPTRTPTPADGTKPTRTPTSTGGSTPTRTPTPLSIAASSAKLAPVSDLYGKVPNFDHIVLILLENRDYEEIIGNASMPKLNALAKKNVLMTNNYAVRHPSLPNYIALMSGDTQGITKDCIDCFVDTTNLADLIETSGRTWKSYQESMPSPCFVGNDSPYVQKHNPLIYFDSIRLNTGRCENSIVPLTQLDSDLSSGQFPNFAFIMPNMCNSGHDCPLDTADQWVSGMVDRLQSSSALGDNSLIIITFDEGNEKNTTTCCGLPSKAGGRIVTVLISPQAKPGITDGSPISHYGLLKTILAAWSLPDLGNTALADTQAILSPWKK